MYFGILFRIKGGVYFGFFGVFFMNFDFGRIGKEEGKEVLKE